MKKAFLICAVASIFAACHSGSGSDIETTKAVTVDSAQYNNTANTDTAKAMVTAPPPVAKEHKEKKVVKETKTNSTIEPVTNTAPSTTSTSSTSTAPQPATTTTQPAATTTPPVTETPTATPAKKGMSSSAKDAIIGGGAGAIGGAIISKKKGKGAIIGGVLGAGAGYILGRHKDKKDTTR